MICVSAYLCGLGLQSVKCMTLALDVRPVTLQQIFWKITRNDTAVGNDPNDFLHGYNCITIGVEVRPVFLPF